MINFTFHVSLTHTHLEESQHLNLRDPRTFTLKNPEHSHPKDPKFHILMTQDIPSTPPQRTQHPQQRELGRWMLLSMVPPRRPGSFTL